MHLPPDQLRAKLDQAGLAAYADPLVALVRPSIRLHGGDLVPNDDLPFGATKLGGRPDLPADLTWPTWNDHPLGFIAQIDLAELATLDTEHALPPDGLLSFFYDADEQPWGGRVDDRDGWRVRHTRPTLPLVRVEFPAEIDERARFRCRSLRPEMELTFADVRNFDVQRLGMSFDEGMAYASLLRDDPVWWGSGMPHRLLGHCQQEQNDMQRPCEAARRGIDPFAYATWSETVDDECDRAAAEWRLLLQVYSDNGVEPTPPWESENGMMSGDVGFLYYWIWNEDLAARRFDRAWLMLQSG